MYSNGRSSTSANVRFSMARQTETGSGFNGPTTHDLHAAALGTCKVLTVLWYATRKLMAQVTIDIAIDYATGA